jgi:broad specificity phosphatase PhoE
VTSQLIILIRHAQSEGNKNRDIHQTVPDHRVRLTPEGHQQALEAGRKLRALLRPDDTLHFFTSPYRRTRETTEGILSALTSDVPSPSPFPRHTVKVYEEPRLREQDFGNFQPCSAEMERMWQERADYGHFFYRIPDGESAADAYDRISGFNDSLWRRFEENDFASVCILVTHGLMTRVFLMKWYHFSVEYFEDLRNVNHCEFVVMKRNLDNGKFILQNQLRTWSELKRERAARGSVSQANRSTTASGIGDSPIPQRRRWGGCPDGCGHAQQNHGSRERPPRRRNTADLFKDDNDLLSSSPKDSSRIPSRQDSLKFNQTRSPPRAQLMRDRYRPQIGSEIGDGAAKDDMSLPDNEDTILDQDPNKPPPATSSATQSPLKTSNGTFKHRFRNAQPGSMSVNEPLLEEELSPDVRAEEVPTPRPFPPQQSLEQNTVRGPSKGRLYPESLRQRLRSPREAALISMAGRDGGGSRSGTGSSDEEAIQEITTTEGCAAQEGDEIGDESEDDEAFPSPNSLTRSTTAISSQHQTQNQHQPVSSLGLALKGAHIPLHSNDTPPNHNHNHNQNLHISTSVGTGTGTGLERAMADALGDQSDAEVTEDDEEMGIKTLQKGEEERILEQERWERRQATTTMFEEEGGTGGGSSSLRADVY